jgi:tetratricopeptide (TPR) repeat protein
MRRSYLLSIIILLSCPAISRTQDDPQTAREIFDRGNAAYQGGDFAGAEALYRQLLDTGTRSGPLYYNLGNACYKQDRLGEAIYFWEQARRMLPGDRDVAGNLEFSKLMIVDRIEVPEAPFPVRLMNDLVHTLTPDQESWALLILFVLANVLFSIYLLVRRPRIALWCFTSSLAAGLLAVALGGSLVWKIYHESRRQEGVVIEQRVEIRSGPGSDYMTVVTVHEGIMVMIRGEAEDWYQIMLPNGWNGWLPKHSLLVF